MIRSTFVFTAALACACAPDLGAGGDGEDDDGMELGVEGGPQVDHIEQGEGVWLTHVDATSEEKWVYIDLSDGSQLEVAEPHADGDWDLGFLRFHIKINGGVSGQAGAEVVPIEDATLVEIDAAPADGYITDEADGEDDNEDPDYALSEWYGYNVMTHVLTPHPRVYVLRTGDGTHYKLQLESYYDDAGSSGNPSFRWSEIDAP